MATSPISHFHQFWKSVTLSLRRTGWGGGGGGGGELWLLGIVILHSKNNSTLFINGRGQSCNIFALNVPVHPIPSCFKCFINGIELKQLSMYTQNCFGGSLLPEVLQLFTHHQFSKNVVLKIVTFGSTNNFIWEYNVFKSQLTTLDHLPHLF